MLVGDKLKKFRNAKGMSIRAVADAAGISQSGLSYIENNTNNPTIDTLEKILMVLGVPLPDFFTPSENDNDKYIPPDISDFSSQKNNQDIIRLIMAIKTSGYSDDIIKEWLTSLLKWWNHIPDAYKANNTNKSPAFRQGLQKYNYFYNYFIFFVAFTRP